MLPDVLTCRMVAVGFLVSATVFVVEKSDLIAADSVDAAERTISLRSQEFDVNRKTDVNDATAAPPAKSNGRRIHLSTAWSQPDQAPEATSARFRIDQSQLDTKAWQSAISKALMHQSDRGFYTLMRLKLEDSPDEEIQAEATKLKEFTEQYHGAGGEYRVLRSGEFLLWEHIHSDRRKNERDPLRLGALSHGRSELWVEAPKVRILNVLGDVVLNRCPAEEMGVLSVKFHGFRGPSSTSLTIAPVVVGGPYGKTFRVETDRDFHLQLPPGDYKILLPDYDVVKSRWEVHVTSQKTTRLDFDANVEIHGSQDPQPAGGTFGLIAILLIALLLYREDHQPAAGAF